MQQSKICCVWDAPFLNFYASSRLTYEKKFIAEKLGKIHPPDNRFRFLYQIPSLGILTLQSCQNFDYCSTHNKFLVYR